MNLAASFIPPGASPVVTQEQFCPLATVVTAGLVTSTALTLLVVPAIYKWFAIKRGDVEL